MSQQAYGYYGNTMPQYAPETVEKPEVKVKSRKKTKVHVKVTPKFMARVYTCMFLAAVFTLVFRACVINEMTRANENLESELLRARAYNEQQTVYMDMATDLNTVEEIAQNQLNMGVPQAYQTVEVSVGMENKAVKVEKEDNGIITTLKNIGSAVMEYLY